MLPAALVIFFTSGVAALSYQVAWQRMLVIFSGADVHAATIVVAAFMVGLGCGSVGGGWFADRVSPLASIRWFAAAELAVAVFGLISPALFYTFLYERIGPLAIGPGGTAGVLVAALFLPTFLMGASLPLLSRGLAHDLRGAAPTVGWLYGLNTIGAAIGAICTTFVLLPHAGMRGSIWVAAMLNLACAASALALTRAGRPPGADRSEPSESAASLDARSTFASPARRSLGAWTMIFALSGFIALSLEIVWFRMLGVMLKSTSFTFGTLLSLYLLGVGLGAMAGSAAAARVRRPAAWFFALQAGAGLYAALSLSALVAGLGHARALDWFVAYFARYEAIEIRSVVMQLQHALGVGSAPSPETGSTPWDFVRLYGLLPALLFGPPTFMAGFSFPLLQRAVHTDLSRIGRRVGALLAANIFGSTLGAFITGLVLLDRLGTSGTLKLLFVLSAGLGALGLRDTPWPRRQGLRIASYAGGVLLAVWVLSVMPDGRRFWASLHGVEAAKVIVAEDGSGVSVIRADPDFKRVVVFVNGLGQSFIPYGNIHTILGAFPAFVHPNPRSAAVIGLGSGDTLFAMAGRPDLEQVTSIEIIEPQLATLREFGRLGYPGVQKFLSDPRIEHVFGDGRLYLSRAGRKYDIIEADALRPTSAYSGNLYSDAYFRLLRDHLNPGGLAVTWAPTPRVIRTFETVFPYVWRMGQVLMGSETPIDVNAPAVIERLRRPAVNEYFASSGVDIEALLQPYLTGSPASNGQTRLLRDATDINTDLHPRDEFDIPPLFDWTWFARADRRE